MNPRKNARVINRGRCYFTTGFGSTSAGCVGLRLESGDVSRSVYGLGWDQTSESERGTSPSEIECRTRCIVSR
jgi:hypothetical protein